MRSNLFVAAACFCVAHAPSSNADDLLAGKPDALAPAFLAQQTSGVGVVAAATVDLAGPGIAGDVALRLATRISGAIDGSMVNAKHAAANGGDVEIGGVAVHGGVAQIQAINGANSLAQSSLSVLVAF